MSYKATFSPVDFRFNSKEQIAERNLIVECINNKTVPTNLKHFKWVQSGNYIIIADKYYQPVEMYSYTVKMNFNVNRDYTLAKNLLSIEQIKNPFKTIYKGYVITSGAFFTTICKGNVINTKSLGSCFNSIDNFLKTIPC